MNRKILSAVAASIAIGLFTAEFAAAADWGNLTGRFVFDGKAPAPQAISINKDPEVCGKAPPLMDEDLVVDNSGGLANVVIWVRTKNVQVNPDFGKASKEKVAIDNKHCSFVPHVVCMTAGQTLEIKNSDPISHNTNLSSLEANAPFNVVIAQNESSDRPLADAEAMPKAVTCNIHPWMKGYLLVAPNPYSAVSDKDGKFRIEKLPAGTELEFQVWHEKPGDCGQSHHQRHRRRLEARPLQVHDQARRQRSGRNQARCGAVQQVTVENCRGN